MDGMKGTFVVEDPKFPFDYDKEEVLELAEWYHKDIDTLTKKFMVFTIQLVLNGSLKN